MIKVEFPRTLDQSVNMMPFIMGKSDSLPSDLRRYTPMIQRCNFIPGNVVYLTVSESLVKRGETQRRPGIHTDATHSLGWGGGGWGGAEGIYVASTDGLCRVWEEDVTSNDVDELGSLLIPPSGNYIHIAPSYMYHIGEYTPHEALPATRDHYRQFFRVVGPKIGAWYAAHSTPNPLGVQPAAKVIQGSKFKK